MKSTSRSKLAAAAAVCFVAAVVFPTLPMAAFGQAVELKKSTQKSQRAYNVAVGIHNQKAWDRAAVKWQEFLAEFEADELAPRAQYYLSISYTQMQPAKHGEAVKAFQALQAKYPEFENMADALLQLGYSQYQLAAGGAEGGYAAAEKTFTDLLASGNETLADDALYYQGESRYFQGNRKGAIESYQKLVDEHAESPYRRDTMYALGVSYEEEKNYPEAGKVYDQFLATFGDDEAAVQQLAEVTMRKGETVLQAAVAAEKEDATKAKPLFAQAETLFAKAAAVENFGDSDHATYRQALATSKQGKFAEAAGLYAKVADNADSPYIKDATMDAGRSYYQAKMHDEAANRFRKVLELGGDDKPEAAHWLARILIDQKKQYAEAAKVVADNLAGADGNVYFVNLKLDQGDALFEQGGDKLGEALTVFVGIAADHKDSSLAPQALYNAAFTARELKKYDDALKYAGEFLTSHEDHSLAADVKYVAAESNLFTKKNAEAEKLYADLVANHKQHQDLEQWQLRLGLSQFLQKKYQDTVATLGSAAAGFKSKNNQAEAQFYVGSSQYRLDKHAESVAALKASYAANPKWRRSDEVLLDLARSQRKAGQTADAIASVNKMLAEFPDSDELGRAHFQLGQYSYDNEDYKTAATEYAAVATDHADSIYAPHALYGKGWSEVKQGDDKAAISSFSALLEKHADHKLAADTYYARAISRQRTGEFDGGIKDIEAFLATNPAQAEKSDALYNRGLCEAGLKKWPDAAATYESILTDDKDYAGTDKVLYELAWAYKEQDKQDDALKNFQALASGHGDSPLAAEAFYHVGQGEYENDEFEKAIAAYSQAKAKATKPDLAESAAYKLGWSHYRQDDFAEALTAFQDQVKAAPQGRLVTDAQLMVGECSYKLEEYDTAVAAFDKALAADPKNSTLDFFLLHAGQAAGQQEKPDWAKAVTLLTRLTTEFTDSAHLPQALYELGWASHNLGKPDEAADYFSKAADEANGELYARSKFMLGEVKFGQKKINDALGEYLDVVFGTGGDNAPDEVKNWVAKSALQAGQMSLILAGEAKTDAQKKKLIAEAVKYFNIVVTKHPQSDVAAAAKKQLEKYGG